MQKEIIQAYKTCPKWSDNEMEDNNNKLAPQKKFSIFFKVLFVKISKRTKTFLRFFRKVCLKIFAISLICFLIKEPKLLQTFCPPFRYTFFKRLKCYG